MTTPDQDAGRRDGAQAALDAYKAGEFLGITQDRQVVDLMVAFADAAVAEAVKERDAALTAFADERERRMAAETKTRRAERERLRALGCAVSLGADQQDYWAIPRKEFA